MPSQSPVHLANSPGDLADVAEHLIPPGDWPPPGTHIVYNYVGDHPETVVQGETRFYVVADEGELPSEGFWWTTLGQMLLDEAVDADLLGPLLMLAYIELLPTWAGPWTAIPVFYRGGQAGKMRWIRTTFKGLLGGGVEEFQFKIDLGNPGSDPDLDEAGCLALAEQVAAIMTTTGGALLTVLATDVVFTEVGCVTMTATEGTSADGTGGDMEASFPTQWSAYTVGGRPTGSAGGVSLPYEVACAVSLQTDHRGASGRGRCYLPPFNTGSMAAGGIYTTGARDNALAGFGALLEEIRENTPYDIVVVSPRRIILNSVTSINIGRVPDSQRRRRRSQDEARTVLLMSV